MNTLLQIPDLFFVLLDKLSVRDLISFSLVNYSINDQVKKYWNFRAREVFIEQSERDKRQKHLVSTTFIGMFRCALGDSSLTGESFCRIPFKFFNSLNEKSEHWDVKCLHEMVCLDSIVEICAKVMMEEYVKAGGHEQVLSRSDIDTISSIISRASVHRTTRLMNATLGEIEKCDVGPETRASCVQNLWDLYESLSRKIWFLSPLLGVLQDSFLRSHLEGCSEFSRYVLQGTSWKGKALWRRRGRSHLIRSDKSWIVHLQRSMERNETKMVAFFLSFIEVHFGRPLLSEIFYLLYCSLSFENCTRLLQHMNYLKSAHLLRTIVVRQKLGIEAIASYIVCVTCAFEKVERVEFFQIVTKGWDSLKLEACCKHLQSLFPPEEHNIRSTANK